MPFDLELYRSTATQFDRQIKSPLHRYLYEGRYEVGGVTFIFKGTDRQKDRSP